MISPHAFTPTTQQALHRTLEATRSAMSEVRENMRIVEEGRNRAEKRVESLGTKCTRMASALAAAEERVHRLRSQLDAVSAERDALAEGLEGAPGMAGRVAIAALERPLMLVKDGREATAQGIAPGPAVPGAAKGADARGGARAHRRVHYPTPLESLAHVPPPSRGRLRRTLIGVTVLIAMAGLFFLTLVGLGALHTSGPSTEGALRRALSAMVTWSFEDPGWAFLLGVTVLAGFTALGIAVRRRTTA